MRQNRIKFKLTKGKTPESWQLPLKGMMLPRIENGRNLGKKKVHYIPGISSVWVEDYEGDEKPEPVVFEKGLLTVDPDNKNLLYLLKNHQWYGIHFELDDDDVTAQKELDRYDLIEKAVEKVSIADEDELRATALIIIGAQANSWTKKKVLGQLKKLAYEKPEDLLKEMKEGDYQGKYVASLAVLKDVLVVNPSQTAVTWPDGKVIVRVAAGQNPIHKVGSFLSENTEESRLALQEIGERIKRTYTKRETPDVDSTVKEITGDTTDNSQKDLSLGDNGAASNEGGSSDEADLEVLRSQYEVKFEKAVPNAMKNNVEWLQTKLAE